MAKTESTEAGSDLVAAVGTYGHTATIGPATTLPGGVTVQQAEVRPIIGAYRRMIRDLEFDICELAPMTYLIARSKGIPLRALPVFLSRGFHYDDAVCRTDARIRTPKDVEGHRFGVRAYSVTTGVWVRGMLQHNFEVDLTRVEWIVDDDDHVLGLDLPDNVKRLPPGESIADAFAAGELQVALKGIAGVGRRGDPVRGWTESDVSEDGVDHHPLIDDPVAAATANYEATGIYPLHRAVVVTEEVVDANPELPEQLFGLFQSAKVDYLRALRSRAPQTDEQRKHLALMDIVGDDPLPYGLEVNQPTIEHLAQLGKEQGLLPQGFDVAGQFYDLNPGS